MIAVKTEPLQFVFGIFKFYVQPATVTKFGVIIYKKLQGIIGQPTIFLVQNILGGNVGAGNVALVLGVVICGKEKIARTR